MRALIVAMLVVVPALAEAQPSSDLKARAKAYVAQGLEAQDDGRYADAIAAYQQAYALVPHPELLFNLGQAHRLDGDAPRALAYYRRYLAIDPHGRVARGAERWVDELERVVGSDAEVDVTAPAPPGATAATPPSAAATARPGRPLRLAGIALGVAGGLSIAAGVKFGLDARRIGDDLGDHDGPWTDALLARQDDGRRAETRMYVLTGAGAAVAIGGAALYLLGTRATVAPIADDTSAGVAVVGRFW